MLGKICNLIAWVFFGVAGYKIYEKYISEPSSQAKYEAILNNLVSDPGFSWRRLSLDDDLSNPNIQKKWLGSFKSYCVEKNLNRKQCFEEVLGLKESFSANLKDEKKEEEINSKRKIAKEKELGF